MSLDAGVKPVEPCFVAELFPSLHARLIDLLRGLAPADWNRPTAAGAWRVRDVAAHLLDGDLRTVSLLRDAVDPPPASPIAGYGELVAYLNGLNAEWVRAARRISPRLLVELLAMTGPEVAACVAALDPFATARHSVAWAGEPVSANWFDIGREYTERWHHQQQIRDAVEAPPLTERAWLHPVLDISMRALPFAYRGVDAEPDTAVVLRVLGEAGGSWSLVRAGGGWLLCAGEASSPACRVAVEANALWRILFHQFGPAGALERLRIEGDERLGVPLAGARAVMA